MMRAAWGGLGHINQGCVPQRPPLDLEGERTETDMRRFWRCLWEQGYGSLRQPGKRLDQDTWETAWSL